MTNKTTIHCNFQSANENELSRRTSNMKNYTNFFKVDSAYSYKMNKLAQSAETGDADSDQEGDPEQLLDEWLGELDNLTGVSL
ncbi:hypothetical protein RN001_008755 [Aquatica leii]|uniref:Uncharacterized protein n=1 Tax=Aquatica leii TaxID=1421715 RepID=A0AAN7PXP3_9COLE|nr:hypothetical protein RN001_008755 [Aquatica leii]